MANVKSIDKKIKVLLIFSLMYIFLSVFLATFLGINYKFTITLLFFVNLFMCSLIIFPKHSINIILTLTLTLIFYSIFLFSFRNIRNLFPVPNLIGSEWVGFANYYKYPLTFDYLFFISLILTPLVIFIVIKKYVNKNS